jgi:hypothetical protein
MHFPTYISILKLLPTYIGHEVSWTQTLTPYLHSLLSLSCVSFLIFNETPLA